MIRVYTKERHKVKIEQFLNSLNLEYEIFTIKDNPSIVSFDLGVSYCYPRKINEPLLSTPKLDLLIIIQHHCQSIRDLLNLMKQ